ncbi:type II secretion system protein [Gluconacetobacter takamatsuzukensis]|uniref:Prepilin-type N-terminal cleavage/methylation domain-containing protein n=1 Tax=Gluconacetobacter takamatsuzukensis TaxID=1286190 RepID=A0A7W4KE74_9PROT|nr:prepilin-type N-terminal cleavage/methylation domain-containing protein [Gluconacetobacter takamatsuzukensis]MBB2205317.1 prepilin-type N-terminal cleavage/methylation domain-containing protein [Gluconacetobacter takamatsuzukensis]
MTAPHPSGRQAGFTLIEVLVAFVIVTLALAVAYRGMLDGIAATRLSNRTQEALSRAQSHLAAVGHGMRLGPLEQDGDDGSSFHWHVRIVPAGTSAGLALYQVQVTESWPDPSAGSGRRAVDLHTLRLGMREAGP